MFTGEEPPGAPETGGDLVRDEQDPIAVAKRAHPLQIPRRVETHPARALDNRLQDHGGQLPMMFGEQSMQLRDVLVPARRLEAAGRRGREQLLQQHPGEQPMHTRDRIAHGHGGEGIAVIAGADGQQPVLLGPGPGVPVLDCQLDRDLDGHGARIAQKNMPERRGRQLHQARHQPHRRLVGEPPNITWDIRAS